MTKMKKDGAGEIKPGDLVWVTWRDSCSPPRKWMSQEDAKDYGIIFCESVGFVIKHDNVALVLAASKSPSDVGDVSAIPTSCVIKCIVVHEGGQPPRKDIIGAVI